MSFHSVRKTFFSHLVSYYIFAIMIAVSAIMYHRIEWMPRKTLLLFHRSGSTAFPTPNTSTSKHVHTHTITDSRFAETSFRNSSKAVTLSDIVNKKNCYIQVKTMNRERYNWICGTPNGITNTHTLAYPVTHGTGVDAATTKCQRYHRRSVPALPAAWHSHCDMAYYCWLDGRVFLVFHIPCNSIPKS